MTCHVLILTKASKAAWIRLPTLVLIAFVPFALSLAGSSCFQPRLERVEIGVRDLSISDPIRATGFELWSCNKNLEVDSGSMLQSFAMMYWAREDRGFQLSSIISFYESLYGVVGTRCLIHSLCAREMMYNAWERMIGGDVSSYLRPTSKDTMKTEAVVPENTAWG